MTMEVTEILAERVKQRLIDMKKSQEWLGEDSGGTGPGVRKALSEKRAVGADTLAAWASSLHVSTDWLLGRDSPDELRISCISAILSSTPAQVQCILSFIETLKQAALDQSEARSRLPEFDSTKSKKKLR